MVAGSSDLKGFAFCVHAVALVYVVNAFAIPNAAVAVIGSYRFDSRLRCAALYAFGGDLVAALVSDGLAAFEGESVVVGEFANCANVNHMYYLPFLVYLIIPYFHPFVKWFGKSFFM